MSSESVTPGATLYADLHDLGAWTPARLFLEAAALAAPWAPNLCTSDRRKQQKAFTEMAQDKEQPFLGMRALYAAPSVRTLRSLPVAVGVLAFATPDEGAAICDLLRHVTAVFGALRTSLTSLGTRATGCTAFATGPTAATFPAAAVAAAAEAAVIDEYKTEVARMLEKLCLVLAGAVTTDRAHTLAHADYEAGEAAEIQPQLITVVDNVISGIFSLRTFVPAPLHLCALVLVQLAHSAPEHAARIVGAADGLAGVAEGAPWVDQLTTAATEQFNVHPYHLHLAQLTAFTIALCRHLGHAAPAPTVAADTPVLDCLVAAVQTRWAPQNLDLRVLATSAVAAVSEATGVRGRWVSYHGTRALPGLHDQGLVAVDAAADDDDDATSGALMPIWVPAQCMLRMLAAQLPRCDDAAVREDVYKTIFDGVLSVTSQPMVLRLGADVLALCLAGAPAPAITSALVAILRDPRIYPGRHCRQGTTLWTSVLRNAQPTPALAQALARGLLECLAGGAAGDEGDAAVRAYYCTASFVWRGAFADAAVAEFGELFAHALVPHWEVVPFALASAARFALAACTRHVTRAGVTLARLPIRYPALATAVASIPPVASNALRGPVLVLAQMSLSPKETVDPAWLSTLLDLAAAAAGAPNGYLRRSGARLLALLAGPAPEEATARVNALPETANGRDARMHFDGEQRHTLATAPLREETWPQFPTLVLTVHANNGNPVQIAGTARRCETDTERAAAGTLDPAHAQAYVAAMHGVQSTWTALPAAALAWAAKQLPAMAQADRLRTAGLLWQILEFRGDSVLPEVAAAVGAAQPPIMALMPPLLAAAAKRK